VKKKVPKPRAKLATAYVVTEDLSLLVKRWCKQVGICTDSLELRYFYGLFNKLASALSECCFPDGHKEVKHLRRNAFDDLLHKRDASKDGRRPREFWISLDDVYVKPERQCESKHNISVTRYVRPTAKDLNEYEQIGYGPRPEGIDGAVPESLDRQIDICLGRYQRTERKYGMSKLPAVLVDDGTFDGGTITNILELFAAKGHPIESVRLGVGTTEGLYEIANWRYPRRSRGRKHTVPFIGASKLCPPILDWVCERDFFPGILYSGKVIGVKEGDGIRALRVGARGIPVRAQYLEGWGDIRNWATLTSGVRQFTIRALELSVELWTRIEELKGSVLLVEELPAIPYRIYDKNKKRMRRILESSWLEVLKHEYKQLANGVDRSPV
jgi:hypothetical protein